MKIRLAVLVLLNFFLTSCYSVSIGVNYLCYVSRAKPFAQVKAPNEEERQLFARVAQIKIFAEKEIGLQPTKNYEHYLRLGRDYLSVVVSAAPPLSFQDYTWDYPFVGPLPYRGYFEPSKARRIAEQLKKKGYDVLMRPVDAFSSLGYLRDPLFSYMTSYSEEELANLIIHESFHATVFIKHDIAFNESLANLVGWEGSRLYLEKKYGTEFLKEKDEKDSLLSRDRDEFRRLILGLKADLQIIYDNKQLDEKQKLEQKERGIENFQKELQEDYGSYFQSDRYEFLKEYPINNAYLALFSLYEDPDDFLTKIFQRIQASGGTLKDFVQLCQDLARKHGRHTRAALEAWEKQQEDG